MVPEMAKAGTTVMVHGGDRNSKSINIIMAGTAWKLKSVGISLELWGIKYGNALRTCMKWNHEPVRKYQLPVNLASLLARFGHCQV